MSNSPTLEEQVKILTKQVAVINEFLTIDEDGEETKTEASDFNDWPEEKQEDFFETLALGNRRYGGGNGKTICQVTPADHQ